MMLARLLTGALALIAGSPVAAQTGDTARGRIEIAGRTPPACLIRTARAGNALNASFVSAGPSSGEIRIAELVDPQTAEPRAAEMVIELPVMCNAAHRLTLTSTNGGLLREGGNARNRQQPFPIHHGAGGVAGEAEEDGFGMGRNRSFDVGSTHLEVVFGIGGQVDHVAAGE